MIKLALIGKSIQHSKSQKVYEKILNKEISYKLIDCSLQSEIPSLDKLFELYNGVSITAPYKKFFWKSVEVDESILSLNAINCIRLNNGVYEGTNTDYLAVNDILSRFKKKYKDLNVCILGDGVMSSVTQIALKSLTIKYEVYSRSKNPDFYSLDLTEGTRNGQLLVINTCSRDYSFSGKLKKNTIFWDYNYNFPVHSEKLGKSVGEYIDGIEMLELQAKYALKFWNIA